MDKRLFPIEEAYFNARILPIIERSYIWKGRPPKISHYLVFCAILYVLRTGIAWRDLPPIFGAWNAVYLRFKRGSDRGLWWRVLTSLQAESAGFVDIIIIDSSTVKMIGMAAVQKGQYARGIGKAGVCTKIHLAIDTNGKAVEIMLSGGNEHDVSVAQSLTQDIIGCHILADKGYDSKKYRQQLENQNNVAVIPPRKLWKKKIPFDKNLYKKRSLIERMFGKLKENRRIATRYDKEDVTFLSFICLAFINLNL